MGVLTPPPHRAPPHQITSQDKTPAVVAKVLEKHGQDPGAAPRFQLLQLLPENRGELLICRGGTPKPSPPQIPLHPLFAPPRTAPTPLRQRLLRHDGDQPGFCPTSPGIGGGVPVFPPPRLNPGGPSSAPPSLKSKPPAARSPVPSFRGAPPQINLGGGP